MTSLETLVRYETYLWNHLDARLRQRGEVSLPTVFALRGLDRHAGAARVQELRQDLGITVGAASKLVDRLERDGLARRDQNPEDRRSSFITLTPAGQEALAAATDQLESDLDAHFSGHDLEPMTRSLELLLDRLNQLTGSSESIGLDQNPHS